MPNMFLYQALIAVISFVGLFFVSLFSYAVRRRRSQAAKAFIRPTKPPLYFRLHRFFLRDLSVESLLFCLAAVQNILRIILLFVLFALFFQHEPLVDYFSKTNWAETTAILCFTLFVGALIMGFICILDLIPRLLAHYYPESSLSISAKLTYPFLFLFSPISFLLYRLMRLFLPTDFLSPYGEATAFSPEKLLELIREADDRNILNEHDKKLLESVFSFRDRIAREVMVPRVNLFALPHDTPIRQAAKELHKEGYSRVPVYKNTQDHILGVLMYKDILTKYMEFEAHPEKPSILDEPIENLAKAVLYTPETKKISLLLQDFRKKQSHLAVVVDEYGGTAGVVTIEDILEEIVGEIADEYDEQEKLYWPLQRGGWIVDGRMNLLDLEDEIGIKIPQEAEYDTVTGYVYFRLGTIPKRGVILHHDDFEIEILHSDDRFVQKVKITPLITPIVKSK